jgi:hypothetical protein
MFRSIFCYVRQAKTTDNLSINYRKNDFFKQIPNAWTNFIIENKTSGRVLHISTRFYKSNSRTNFYFHLKNAVLFDCCFLHKVRSTGVFSVIQII